MNIYEDYEAIVASVANEYGRRYRQFGAERDDFVNECYLWLFEHPEKLAEFLEHEHADRLIARTLRNHCYDYGETLKAQHLGYSRDDLAYYSRNMCRELLPSLWDQEAWLEPPVAEETAGRGGGDPATGGNWIATLADLSRAYDQLREEDRDLLAAFHRDSYTNKLMAEMHDVTEQTMSYRHDRAIKRLVDILGGPRPRPQHGEELGPDYVCNHSWAPGRRAVSNASARAYQQNIYEES